MDCWINSNSGDYVTLDNSGKYTLCLISRYDGASFLPAYTPADHFEITHSQFIALKGFIPIKSKKLFNNRKKKIYAPTIKGGEKGDSKRIPMPPTKAEARELILKELGL